MGRLDNFIEQAERRAWLRNPQKRRADSAVDGQHERLEVHRFVRLLRSAQRACGRRCGRSRHSAILDLTDLGIGKARNPTAALARCRARDAIKLIELSMSGLALL